MLHSLYDFYSKTSFSLYEVREHFLRLFYPKDDALKSISESSKIAKLLDSSLSNGTIPTYEDYLTLIESMLKFMFKSVDTQALAVIDAAILWDIKVNSNANLTTQDELKQEIIKVFQRLKIHKEIPEEELFNTKETLDNKKSWSLVSFARNFREMRVREFVNSDTGEKFKSCVFYDGKNEKTFVSFSSKLGELTPTEIESMKDELIVVKSSKGKYSLYKAKCNKGKKVNI